MIRRAPSRAGFLAAPLRIAGKLFRLAPPLVGRVEELNDQMRRDVGLGDGRRTEARMRSELIRGQPFDPLHD